MYVLVGGEEWQRDRIVPTLRHGTPTIFVEHVHSLAISDSQVPHPDCVLVLSDSSHVDASQAHVAALVERYPWLPVVVVAPRSIRSVTCEGGPPFDLVWLEEVERGVRGAVDHAISRAAIRRLCAAVSASTMRPELRAALAHACRAEPPLRHVMDLASAVSRDRCTVWRWWQAEFAEHPTLRLQDFLHWILLIDAAGLKAPRRGWVSVAEELRVHHHTLGRLARRLAGQSLGELGRCGPKVLVPAFVRTVIDPVASRN